MVQLFIILLFLGFNFFAHIEAVPLCGTNVSLTSENWGIESEIFNVTLAFQNVTQKTVFSLVPEWDKLAVSENTFEVMDDSEVEVNMTGQHFYLYKVKMSCLNEESQEESEYFEVPVSRTKIDTTVAIIFQRIMTAFLAFAMLLMGCELKFEIVKSYLVRPLAPAAGMLCQYVCMPIMAYVIGYLLLRENTFARYGLILVGCSPGGSFSNFWAGIINYKLE